LVLIIMKEILLLLYLLMLVLQKNYG